MKRQESNGSEDYSGDEFEETCDESCIEDVEFTSEEMKKLLQLDEDPLQSPRTINSYSPQHMFPSWILNQDDWKATAASNRDQISEIANIPFHHRAQEQTSTLVHWLMSIWSTARQMGYKKCASMTKVFHFLVYEKGDNIITEGEHGMTFFIILSGTCVVHKEGIGVVASIGKGKSFGEVALTEGNSLRTATVRADSRVEAFRLHKGDYDYFVKNIQLAERRENQAVLRSSPLLKSFGRAVVAKMATNSFRQCYRPGDYIFRQGDDPDKVYFIIEGSVAIIKEISIAVRNRWPKSKNEWDVVAKKRVKHHLVATLGKHDYFGEYSIVVNSKRAASARAKTKCTLLCVDRNEFVHFTQAADSVSKLEEMIETYDKDEEILSQFSELKGGPSTTAQLNDCVILSVPPTANGVEASPVMSPMQQYRNRKKKTQIFKIETKEGESTPIYEPDAAPLKNKFKIAALAVAAASKFPKTQKKVMVEASIDPKRREKDQGDVFSMHKFRKQMHNTLDAAMAVNTLVSITSPNIKKRLEPMTAIEAAEYPDPLQYEQADDDFSIDSQSSQISLCSTASRKLTVSTSHKSLKFNTLSSSPVKHSRRHKGTSRQTKAVRLESLSPSSHRVSPMHDRLHDSARVTFQESPKELNALRARNIAGVKPVLKFSDEVEDHPILMMMKKSSIKEARGPRQRRGVISTY